MHPPSSGGLSPTAASPQMPPNVMDLELEVQPIGWQVRMDGVSPWMITDAPILGGPSEAAALLREQIQTLDLLAHQLVPVDPRDYEPATRLHIDRLHWLAAQIGDALAAVFSAEALDQVRRVIVDPGGDEPALLRVRIRADDATPESAAAVERALSLPWELLRVDGCTPVADGTLDIAREAVNPVIAPPAPPSSGLSVVATVAAPVDATALDHTQELWRILRAFDDHDERLRLTTRGTLADLVEAVAEIGPSAVHFSGHGEPGALRFEDDAALSDVIAAEVIASRLAMAPVGVDPTHRAPSLPRLIYLASCYGASLRGSQREGEAGERAAANERPSSAAALHRAGFAHVVAYFGPVGDQQSSRVEQAFYRLLAAGRSTRAAIRVARRIAMEPLAGGGQAAVCYPLGWMQLALYQRGDQPIALPPAEAPPVDVPAMMRALREPATLAGAMDEMPLFGRRVERAELIRRWRAGERHLVVSGLGGIGKTRLCADVLDVLARAQGTGVPVLWLDGRSARKAEAPLSVLWHGLEAFHPWAKGETDRIVWLGHLEALQHDGITGEAFVAAIVEITRQCGGLLIYLDDGESLQADEADRGAWRDDHVERMWSLLVERCTPHGPLGLLASTRYAPRETPAQALVPLGPMSRFDVRMWQRWLPASGRLSHADADIIAKMAGGRPRTVELLDALVRQQLDASSEVADWSALREGVEQHTHDDLLLDALWAALSPAQREHLGRLTVVTEAVPGPVIVALGTRESAISLARMGLVSPVRGQAGTEWWWAPHSLVREWVAQRWIGDRGAAHRVVARALLSGEIEPLDARRWRLAAEHALAGEGGEAWLPVRMAVGVLTCGGQGGHCDAIELLDRFIAATEDERLRAIAMVERCRVANALGIEGPDQHLQVLPRAANAIPTSEVQMHAIVELIVTLVDAGHPLSAIREVMHVLEQWENIEGRMSEVAANVWHATLIGIVYNLLPAMGWGEHGKHYAPDFYWQFKDLSAYQMTEDRELPQSFWFPRIASPRAWLSIEPRLAAAILGVEWWFTNIDEGEEAARMMGLDLAAMHEQIDAVLADRDIPDVYKRAAQLPLMPLRMPTELDQVGVLDQGIRLMEQAVEQYATVDALRGSAVRWQEARSRIDWVHAVARRLEASPDDPGAAALQRRVSTALSELFIVDSNTRPTASRDEARLRFEHGRILLQRRLFADALDEFDRARGILEGWFPVGPTSRLADHPDVAGLLHASAHALYHLDRPREAINRLSRAADALAESFGERSPLPIAPRLDRAAIRWTRGEHDAARADVEACRALAEQARQAPFLCRRLDAWLAAATAI